MNPAKPPFVHLLTFAVGLAAAYILRRGLRGGGTPREPLPVVAGLAGVLALLTGWSLLSRNAGLALGGSILFLYLWFAGAVRPPLLRRLDWLALLACCLWVVKSNVTVESIKVPFTQDFFSLGKAAFPFAAAWLWAVVYVIASPAQAEETATGLCLLISVVFLVISILQASFMGPLPSAFSAGLLGCCLGISLGSPVRLTARVGPGGRAMLGLMLATISVAGALKNTAFLVLIIPFLALALPLMDITYFVVFGWRRKPPKEIPTTSISTGNAPRANKSLHGFLLAMGMKQEQVALLFYFATGYLGAIAILLVALIKVHFILKFLLLAVFMPVGFLLFYAAYKVLCPAGEATGTVELFGLPIANLTGQETLDRIAQFVLSRRPHHVVTSDSLMLVRAQRDEEFRGILEKADLITPDGTGVVWAGRLLGQPFRERVPGVELVDRICQMAAERGFSVYLLGGEPGVADCAAGQLRQRYPSLRSLGARHGYFPSQEETGVVEEIARLQPDVLFVGMGVPRQEMWISKNLQRLGVPACIGVGGSFDVISGRVPRAPAWMQNCGLEWLYRAVKEPKRLPRLLGLPRFLLMTIRGLRRRDQKEQEKKTG